MRIGMTASGGVLLALVTTETLAAASSGGAQSLFTPIVVAAGLGAVFGLLGCLWQQRTRLARHRHRLEILQATSQDAVFDWELASGRTWFSSRWRALLGEDDLYQASCIEDWRTRIHPDDLADTDAQLHECLQSDADCFISEHRLRNARGEYLHVQVRAKAQRDNAGRVQRLSGSVTDVTSFKRQAEALLHQAMHDGLTGLPNRALLYDRLQQALLVAERESANLALVFMDLDRFKEINDTLGHAVGDAVLRQIGPKLRRLLRSTDTVARLGGDEFALLLPTAGCTDAQRIAANIHKALDAPLDLAGQSFYTSASIGIAVYPRHGLDADTLMQHAEVAMYEAKHAASGFAVYNAEQDKHSISRLTLTSELRHAIDHGELQLYYQPKINLQTGGTIGIEALVRWNSPTRGLLMPDVFIPLAEQTGLIKPLARWVIREALHQCAAWREQGIDVSVAVNLSVRNLQDPYLPQEIQLHLSQLGIDASRLLLEITESAMMQDPIRALDILTSLYTMGVRLSVDDFGTGYSSLSYLKRMPVSEIKIDKSFVMDMHADEDDASIVRATIDMAHSLGLRVVAEGVDNPDAHALLTHLGCDAAQGFHFSRPLPADQITAWMRETMPSATDAGAHAPLH